jgi:glycosyltransferase involved in cell wall biosynthesis
MSGGSRPKVLFLVHRIPYPPNRGDRIRSFHILDFLARRADLALAFLSETPPSAEALRALRERCSWIGWARWGRCGRWLRAAWSFASGKTATEGLFASAQLRRQLRDWLRHHRPDAIMVFCSSMVQYLDLPGLDSVRTVVDLVDVDSQKWFDYARLSRGWRRWAYEQEGHRLRQLERWIGQRAHAVLLTGPHEAALYRPIVPEANIQVVINGVDTEYFRPDFSVPSVSEGQEAHQARPNTAARGQVAGRSAPESRMSEDGAAGLHSPARGPSEGQARCVFVGALDYQANIDGIVWFCQQVWPLVRRQRPDGQLVVVGSSPTGAVHRLAGQTPGFHLVGPVPDVRPYLAEAEVVVVPLRVARGIQNKVLEGLAMGKAVLATPQALEGLAVQPGIHAESAAEPADWAEKLLALWADPHRRAALGQAGRRFVQTHHQWDQVLRPLARILGLPESEPVSQEVDTFDHICPLPTKKQ